MGVWKQVTSQVGGIFKQAAKQAAQEPLELGQSVVSQVMGQDSTGTGENISSPPVQPTGPGLAGDPSGGFQSPNDLARYEQLSGRKDEIELKQLRSQLHNEWSVETNIDQGMQRARMEYQQKEQERNKEEEQKKEQEEWVVEKKKQEDFAVVAAQSQNNGEKQAWGAG